MTSLGLGRIYDQGRAAQQHEDPARMCRAIREMRVALQKSGASRIANNVAASNFAKARQILSDTEKEVKERFPYIHQAATQLPDNDTLPGDSYINSDAADSIRLMMNMRSLLEPLLRELEDELQKVEGQLQ